MDDAKRQCRQCGHCYPAGTNHFGPNCRYQGCLDILCRRCRAAKDGADFTKSRYYAYFSDPAKEMVEGK